MTTETTPMAQTQTANHISPIVTDGEQPVVSSPVVEPNQPEADPAAGSTETPPNAATETNANKATPEWAQKRINELTAKRYEAERRVQEERDARIAVEKTNTDLLAQIAKGSAPNAAGGTQPETKTGPSPEDIDKMVAQKAAEIAQVNEFNKVCNDIVAVGRNEFKDTWDESVKNLGLVGALGPNVSTEFLETAVELKNPARILNHLGQNLEEAERIVKLPPKKMALEMARIEAQLNAPAAAAPAAAISNAPAPVIPVGGAAKPGNPNISDPDLDSSAWFELRAKQVEERKMRYRRS